jgi:hypothetical protein
MKTIFGFDSSAKTETTRSSKTKRERGNMAREVEEGNIQYPTPNIQHPIFPMAAGNWISGG